MGILGAGNIGRKVAARYKAFETEILYYDIAASDYMEKELNARRGSIEEIVREADILSIHDEIPTDILAVVGGGNGYLKLNRGADRQMPIEINISITSYIIRTYGALYERTKFGSRPDHLVFRRFDPDLWIHGGTPAPHLDRRDRCRHA